MCVKYSEDRAGLSKNGHGGGAEVEAGNSGYVQNDALLISYA